MRFPIYFLLCGSLFAQSSPTPTPSVPAPPPDAALSAKDIEALKLSKTWIDKANTPRITDDGKLIYVFGRSLPIIFTRLAHVTDIELEPGERVISEPVVGDSVRFGVAVGVSGTPEKLTTHIYLKAKEIGLQTTMVVTTDRRVYHFLLKSTDDKWTPRVAFDYPEKVNESWAAYLSQVAFEKEKNTLPVTQQDMRGLHFDYEIEGRASWKPLRVYNDGVKTYVQMPKTMKQTEAPVLLLLDDKNKEQIVNYRLLGDRFIVDYIFDRAVLVAGVGRKQSRIVISRLKTP